jgi:hypothetical protein
MPGNLLAAGAVLVLWTLIMLVWVAATRFPAMAKAGIDVKTAQPGGRNPVRYGDWELKGLAIDF